jgi:nucleotide-binding universal stress UspA family protein
MDVDRHMGSRVTDTIKMRAPVVSAVGPLRLKVFGRPLISIGMAIERVLVAIGPRDEGHIDEMLQTVTDVAGPAGATAVLFYALTDDEFEEVLADLDLDPTGDRLSPTDLARRHLLIERAIERLDAAGIDHEVRGAVGDPQEAIGEEAEATQADLLVIGGQRRSPAGKAVFGSLTQDVLLTAPCPVVFVRRD